MAVLLGTRLAVAVLSGPHLVATTYRLWLLRADIDRRVLLRFGFASAAGGLAGAVFGTFLSSPVLSVVLGALLILGGTLELTGIGRRMVIGDRVAVSAGALSGFFGGLVGNQGGIRAAALLRFDLPGPALVATSTATALLVDVARVPVYVATNWNDLLANLPLIGVLTAGVLAGTIFGAPILRRLPEAVFRRVLAVLLIGLGILLVVGVRQ